MPLGSFAAGVAGLCYIVLSIAIATRHRQAGGLALAAPARLVPRIVLAAVVLLAGLALLAGVAVPFLAFFGSVVAGLVALGMFAVIVIRGGGRVWPIPVLLLAGSLGSGVAQPLGLKVLLLPKADDLPYRPVAAKVVKTYPEGVWFESVRAGADGTLYLAANRGLDFSRSDYYRHALGEVIARSPDGTERVVFSTPAGTAAGAFAVKPDGTLYMSSNAAAPGIWRITPDGAGTLFAPLPAGAWPNGLDFGPDGMLYAPDSALGLVWRIDPANGRATVALRDPSLSARPFIALAPGGNGLHFVGHDMIVTVSDRTRVLRFAMDAEGHFSGPSVIATGIPGDDFAVGRDGSLFITTHPYNTLVRVSPDGQRTIVADARQGIVGATDATFGRTDADRDTLYVAIDGGAFTGGPNTRGALIALKPYAAP